MKTLFDADYYERGVESGKSLYKDYRWLPDLTLPMAKAIVAGCGINRSDVILDFGCAKGYLVKALRQMGFLAYGTDISEYALSQCDQEIEPYLFPSWDTHDARFDWVICKDVLEHIPEHELDGTLASLRRQAENIFVAVPLGNNGQYTIPDMEKDVTHQIRRPLWWWSGRLEEAGFKHVASTFAMKGVKENWTTKYKFGNGFLIAH